MSGNYLHLVLIECQSAHFSGSELEQDQERPQTIKAPTSGRV